MEEYCVSGVWIAAVGAIGAVSRTGLIVLTKGLSGHPNSFALYILRLKGYYLFYFEGEDIPYL